MVALDTIKSSNTNLPTHLTSIFIGATSGIGLYTLLAFAKHCPHPTAYFIGRSQTAATSILSQLHAINPAGKYTFIESDVALIKNVDTVCERIKKEVEYVNILVLSQGTMISGVDTEEGLHAAASLILHSRTRFALNLLPLLQRAPTLRRVLSISFGTKEGPITSDDIQARNVGPNLLKARGQAAACVTLSLEEVAKKAGNVGFIHGFPGPVRSNIARGVGVANFVMRGLFRVVGPWVYIPSAESGERHLFLATSGRFPGRDGGANGVGIEKGGLGAKGTGGEVGSGVYVVDEKCESGGEAVVEVIRKLKEEKKGEWVWKELTRDFVRITGKESL